MSTITPHVADFHRINRGKRRVALLQSSDYAANIVLSILWDIIPFTLRTGQNPFRYGIPRVFYLCPRKKLLRNRL